ncbi:MAG: NADH-quinone oxidoreductase subunit N [Acidimicrobiales bacterium]
MLAQIDSVVGPEVDWSGLLPLLFLAGGAVFLLTFRSLVRSVPDGVDAAWTAGVGIATLVAVGSSWDRVSDDGVFGAVGDQLVVDGFALFVTGVIASAVVLSALLLHGYTRREAIDGPELYVLLMLSAAGGVTMAAATDLIVLFLGLETLSIAAYVMAAMNRRRVASTEAGLKYFVLGAFSSAFLLYGIALVYGATGSTNLIEIRDYLDAVVVVKDAMLLAGLAFMLVGFGFKVAAVPFHTWTPDVYQGAPTPVVAYMASGVKVAGFAAVLRVFVTTFSVRADDWQPALYALAVATLVMGAVLAIVQSDVKRMLAYSSISHAGFVLIGVQAASHTGTAAALFYLGTYSFLVIGSFGVVSLVAGEGDRHTALSDLDGLATRRPALALAFTVFLLAQAGVPLTSGFVAKFEVIGAAIDARSFWLAIVAMVTAVVSAFLYLRIMLSMYLGTATDPDGEPMAIPLSAALAILVAVVVTIGAGVPGLSDVVDELARDAVPRLVAAG